MPSSLHKLYNKLFSFYGNQGWWPSFDFKKNKFNYAKENSLCEPEEKQKQAISFGSILTQNTNWHNAMKALISLNKKKMLSIKALAEENTQKIAEAIKSAGYYNQKAVYLKEFSQHIKDNYGCLTDFFSAKNLSEIRAELLSLKGIGFETVDSILLYAGFKPVFMVDAYTRRIYNRIFNENLKPYSLIQKRFMNELPENTTLYNEMHALLVKHAQSYCFKTRPLCEKCFLRKNCKQIQK